MRALLGMSMPIIVRQGKLSQQVEIKKPQLGSDTLELELHRKGQASVYGLLTANFTPAGEQQTIEIGRAKGVSVLTPLEWRKVEVPLSYKDLDLSQGELVISYSNLEKKSSQSQPLLTEYRLQL